MNILKFGRGDFFGIMIPGIFLSINIYYSFPGIIQYFGEHQTFIKVEGIYSFIIPFVFIVSYIFGIALRLIKPTLLEKLSFVLLFPFFTVGTFYKFFFHKRVKKQYTLKELFLIRIHRGWESWPYIDWLYDAYIPESQLSYSKFFNNLLNTQFKSDRDLMKGQTFLNQCKVVVMELSSRLNDEIIFCEGLVRFLSGISCALIISIILIFLKYLDMSNLLYIYIILLLLFIYKLRHIRVKEIVTILTSYWIILQKKSYKELL